MDLVEARRQFQAWLEGAWDPDIALTCWWMRLADSGWAAPTWPRESMGRGLPRWARAIVNEELARIGAPGPPGGIGYSMAGPTLIDHGSTDQLSRYIRPLLTGEERWCQLFSEPAAGSDLAALTTVAYRDGDSWLVTGQKVWSSQAADADFGMLLARTDRYRPRHQAITWFILPMHQAGVDVQPLRQMTGSAEFNEVFLDGARVSGEHLVGELNGGWRVALSTLAYERTNLAGPGEEVIITRDVASEIRAGEARRLARHQTAFRSIRGSRWLLDLARRRNRLHDAVVRQDLARLYSLNQIARWSARRAAAGGSSHPSGSLMKLASSRSIKLAADLGLRILGTAGALDGNDAPEGGQAQAMALWAPAVAIAGGTDEIQRNIVAERLLGLPRDPVEAATPDG